MKNFAVLTVILFPLLLAYGSSQAQINCGVGGNTAALQSAIDTAVPGQTITVTGTCNGTLLIRNEIQRIALNGGGGANGAGGATINGGVSTSPTFNVRGKSIVIQGFIISGGQRGIHINRNSNAVIQNVEITSAASDGILIDTASFAPILTSSIHNNGGNGIHISEGGSAHVGFSLQEDAAASPNSITSNTGRGIMVSRGASARIVSNTISNNLADGIWVTGSSQADISGNTINSNGSAGLGSGVFVNNGSNAILGHPTSLTGENTFPDNFFSDSNSTSGPANNVEAGVKCNRNGTIDGQRGPDQLNGAATTLFDSSCLIQYQ